MRIEAIDGVAIRWQIGSGESRELTGAENQLGVRIEDLPTASLPAGADILLTVDRTSDDGREIKEEHRITIQ